MLCSFARQHDLTHVKYFIVIDDAIEEQEMANWLMYIVVLTYTCNLATPLSRWRVPLIPFES